MAKRLLTRAEAYVALRRTGRSVTQLARELGVGRRTVSEVLAGRKLGIYGDAHIVAVALGIKDGVIVPDPISTIAALRAQDRRRTRMRP